MNDGARGENASALAITDKATRVRRHADAAMAIENPHRVAESTTVI